MKSIPFQILNYDKLKICNELWDIDNGITYCVKCHIEEDKMRARFSKKNKSIEVM